mmetsp:Transcript_11623/g.38430  ORF Transcript_11623/g.38430 Transcript_11623/m.38430 type:complete len:170 (-) Transcript_11623:167-676(-)
MRWCVARFNVCDADFDHIAALHGALFHTLGHMAPLVRFPAEFAQRVCPDDASNVYECRHGIGHGVLYAVWLQRPELAGYSVRHQPRPYGLERATEEERRAVDAMCEQADALPSEPYLSVDTSGVPGYIVDMSRHEAKYGEACRTGARHSVLLFDKKLEAWGMPPTLSRL